ncbi:tetratricopeptide repeat-containing sensor histidine kinase [Winogradskyella tangerina]|uniref:tetratricopeptide repeat-containing sensor histidine kinase n=1 Tax=Winogradskyella tangerina TaxID=2023240 RepID=UPI000DBE4931|nr:tetratricopeptide repeat-containing sensor histidine kinase [Winogradskyella tangerina]
MKYLKKSFLFFCLAFGLFCCSFFQPVCAQQPSDSLDYYRKVALQPQNAPQLLKAKSYFNKQYNIAQEMNEYNLAMYHLYFLGSLAYKTGDYYESEQYLVEALEFSNKTNPSAYKKELRKSILNLLGNNYKEQQNRDKANEIYERVLELAENATDSAIVYNNISIVYRNANELTHAREELEKAYSILPKVKDSLTTALILDNLGFLMSTDGDDGLPLMFKALDIREKVGDASKTFTSYSHLSEYYQEKGDITNAKLYANKALDFSNKIKSPSYRNRALGLLVDLSDDNYAREFKVLNDSLLKTDQDRENDFALLKYDYSEFQREALESQLEEERQRSRAVISGLIALSIGLISIVTFYLLRARHRKEKLQQVINTESRISKQVHDEVANNVFQIMTKFENDSNEQKDLVEELNDLYYKARDISNQHGLVDSSKPILESLEELMESYETDRTNIVVKGLTDVKWKVYSDIYKTTIYKVLQELLINMKKYSKATLVLFVFEMDGKKLKIIYSDNGEGTDLVKHTGLLNTENRIYSIGGTITFESKPKHGFKAKIVI